MRRDDLGEIGQRAGCDVDGIAAERVANEDGLAMLPGHVAGAGAMVREAGQREEQVGEPVEIDEEELRHRFLRGEVHDLSLGAAADGAGEVQRGGLRGAGGQHERRERRQFAVGGIDDALELGDPVGGEARLLQRLPDLVGIGRGEVAADGEEVALDGLEQRILEVASGAVARTRPMTELSSSTSP